MARAGEIDQLVTAMSSQSLISPPPAPNWMEGLLLSLRSQPLQLQRRKPQWVGGGEVFPSALSSGFHSLSYGPFYPLTTPQTLPFCPDQAVSVLGRRPRLVLCLILGPWGPEITLTQTGVQLARSQHQGGGTAGSGLPPARVSYLGLTESAGQAWGLRWASLWVG